jgi:hypothetical protein
MEIIIRPDTCIIRVNNLLLLILLTASLHIQKDSMAESLCLGSLFYAHMLQSLVYFSRQKLSKNMCMTAGVSSLFGMEFVVSFSYEIWICNSFFHLRFFHFHPCKQPSILELFLLQWIKALH